MFCENCGGKLRQENDSLICTKCGSEFGLDYMEGYEEYANPSESVAVAEKATTEAIPSADVAVAAGDAAVAPRGFSSKKHILLIAIGAVVAVGIIVFGIVFGTSYSRKQSVAQGFEIAERYLSELKYEQAVIEYLNILEIEPMNVEAYLGLAEAYIGMGDYEKAIEILEKGYEMTSDDTLKGDIMVRAYLGWGQSLVDEKQYEKALEVLNKGYEQTGDERLKIRYDELVEEMSKPKLLFSDLDMVDTFAFINFGHYVKRDGDLWRPCDKNGNFISEKKYKYIENFVGTEENHYSVIRTEDGRVFSIDKNYNELFEIENPDEYYISEHDNPMILSWSPEYQKKFLKVYTVDGKLLYEWYENKSILGNGKDPSLDDWVYPEEVKTYTCSCDNEFHKDFFVESIYVELDVATQVYEIDSDVMVFFSTRIVYDYDHTAEEAEEERRRQEALANGGVYTWASGATSHDITVKTCLSFKFKDGKLNITKNEEYSENNHLFARIPVEIGEDYAISATPTPMPLTIYELKTNGKVNKMYSYGDIPFGYDCEKTNFDYIANFFNDKVMICGKYTDNKNNTSQYALFKINWLNESAERDTDQEILNEGHERLSEFYSSLSCRDNDKELGYMLAQKGEQWGYISIETGEELAMYDDASNFHNGYAVVTTNGMGCVIDKNFEVVSDTFPCESASVIGDGAFLITNGEKHQRLELE